MSRKYVLIKDTRLRSILTLSQKNLRQFFNHGTATRFLSSILKEGLRPGQRHHIHLSTGTKTAITVGKRYGKPVVLKIASGEMYQLGFKFLYLKMVCGLRSQFLLTS